MSILTVGSNNEKFSYIIQKNPATISDSKTPFVRELRRGKAYGWFTDKSGREFRMLFKDSDIEVSFNNTNNGGFEYLDKTRYSSPYAPILLISKCLSTAAKSQSEFDTSSATITVEDGQPAEQPPETAFVLHTAYCETLVRTPNMSALANLVRHYSNSGNQAVNVSLREIHSGYHMVRVEADTVYKALNILQIVCLVQCLYDNATYVRLSPEDLEKYVRCLNASDAPYFVRYLFQRSAVRSRQQFNRLLQDMQGSGMKLCFGDTRQQRFDAINKALGNTRADNLVDIGCGEMFYSLRMRGEYECVYAVEKDEDRHNLNLLKVEDKGGDNVVPLHATATAQWVQENAELFDDADVLLTEVVEHMEYESAVALVKAILEHTCAWRVCVTVPNRTFNVMYDLEDDEFRHDDHKWEPTEKEFRKFVLDTKPNNVSIENFLADTVNISGVGDSVDGEHCTLMCMYLPGE
jgi:hypothetical protein